jgi:predicted nuclease with TOPRIM domain
VKNWRGSEKEYLREDRDRLRAEVARLQGEVERLALEESRLVEACRQAESEAQSERDDARNAARLCGEVEAEVAALRARVEELEALAGEVVLWIPKLIAPGGLNPPGYCPPLERLRAALRGGKGE